MRTLVDMEAPLVAVRCSGVVDQTIDTSKCRLCVFNKTFPVALFGDICLVKSHAVGHGLDCTLAAIFIDVGHHYFCPLLCK